MLLAHVKEMKQERDKANSKYEQVNMNDVLTIIIRFAFHNSSWKSCYFQF